jgi:hypothetical protein
VFGGEERTGSGLGIIKVVPFDKFLYVKFRG